MSEERTNKSDLSSLSLRPNLKSSLTYSAQGITVVAAVAGTYFLTNKPQQVRDRRQQVLTNQLPPDPDSITSASPEAASLLKSKKTTPSDQLATTSLQTHDRGPRISQVMQQTEDAIKGDDGRVVKPRKVSEFGKRLEEAERLSRENDK